MEEDSHTFLSETIDESFYENATSNNELDEEYYEFILDKLDELSQKNFEKFLRCLDNLYYNYEEGGDTIPDELYDEFRTLYVEKFGEYKHIGAKPSTTKVSESLPYFMGSMEKIKIGEQKELDKWLKTNPGPFAIEEKLDGASILLIYDSKGRKKLYSRGEGTIGFVIDSLLPYLNLPNLKDMAIRLELVMKKKTFQEMFSTKNKNPRNTVAGVINSSSSNTIYKREDKAHNVDPVAFEIIKPAGLLAVDQVKQLKKLGFKIPQTKIIKHTPSMEILVSTLKSFREKSEYEIDGLIINDYSRVHDRVNEVNTSGNPKYAISFKGETETAITTVIKVIWTGSRLAKSKPRVQVEPVELAGSTNRHATGDNAKYIVDNKIGPGTIVEITKANEIIPKIIRVIQGTKAQLPDKKYHWNDTKVNIILDDKDDEDVVVSIIAHFFKTLKAKGVSKATIRKLVRKNYTDITEILGLSLKKLKEFFGPKQSENIYDAFHLHLKDVELWQLMAATTYFGEGMGETKLSALTSKFPDILDIVRDDNELIQKIGAISGWSVTSAEQFLEGLNEFDTFLLDNPEITIKKHTVKVIPSTSKIAGKKIVLTGSKKIEDQIIKLGGILTTSVSVKTDIVVAVDIHSTSGKAVKARNLSIELLSVEDFTKKYLK